MTKCLLILSVLLLTVSVISAQGIGINNDKAPADNSALLDVKSTTKGVLIPRMDFGARNIAGSHSLTKQLGCKGNISTVCF
ncbi:MAG: hypothetical protein JWP81_2885 [Ferruginibacter sp.]|nr:hypothetical protein [Ferruginibacter sp.]